MKLNYQLSKADFLEFQLYGSSKSKRQKKSRIRSRFLVPTVYLLLALFLFNKDIIEVAVVFVFIAVIWVLLHPMYISWRYKNHFSKHIDENYADRIGKIVELELEEDHIMLKDFTSESKYLVESPVKV